MAKKLTLIVLPQETRRVKRYSIPRFFPLVGAMLGMVLFAGFLTFSFYAYHQYSQLKDQSAELNRLRQKTVQQNVQILAFNDKMRLLEKEMAKLRQFDRKLRATANKAPLLKERRRLAVGGSESEATRPKASLKANSVQLIRQMHRELDLLLAEASFHEQSQQELGKFFEDSKSILASTPNNWPIKGPFTSYFGYRPSPFGGRGRVEFHRGLDIGAPTGTPIVTPADGIVLSTMWNSGYGLIMTINHGYGVVTRYAHLSKTYVEPGQAVRRGEPVAAVGRSGRTTGSHLHYEVILKGIPVNPMRFLTARK